MFSRILVVLFFALAACQTADRTLVESSPSADPSSHLVYVGTSSGDPEEGIYTLRFRPDSAEAFTRVGAVEPIMNPSFLALASDKPVLYAVSEAGEGTVAAYRIDEETGALTLLNEQTTGGGGPAYVSTDQTGQWVLVANYGGGSVSLLPVEDDGRLGARADLEQHDGSGPDEERQEAPHAHYVHVGPDNRYVYAADLGTDRVRIYRLDTENGALTPSEADPLRTPPGTGPRHLDFHPNGRTAYLISELSGTVTAHERDAETGALTPFQTLSALPGDFDGENKSADIHVHPSGRWLYASNRGDYDSIAVFAIDEATGELTLLGHQTEDIHWPRHFAIAPSGRHLLVANRRANEVVAFEINQETGRLTSTGQRIEVTEPTNILWGMREGGEGLSAVALLFPHA